MAVTCPRCARHYDVSLFAFGRTIHCTCGARVGREVEERRIVRDPDPRFLCDAMLGRLARWLRAIDYDAAFDPAIDDAELVHLAVEEERVLLTRDRRLPEEWRVASCLVLEADSPLARLREVHERLRLPWPRPLFRRCLACNTPLEPLPAEKARGLVPPRVGEAHERFTRCPGCGRIYWGGSHARRMRRALHRALGTGGER